MLVVAMTLAAIPATATEPEVPELNAEVINGQLNFGDVFAGLNLTANNVWGDVNATSAAIGNSFSAELGGDALADNFQRTDGAVVSELNASVDWIEGDVNLTSAAVGNTASVISEPFVPCGEEPECPATDEASLDLTNTQLVNLDPSAWLNVTASGVGEVNGTAAAIGNSLSVEAWNEDTTVNTWQAVNMDTTAIVNASVSDSGRPVATSALVSESPPDSDETTTSVSPSSTPAETGGRSR